MSREGVTEPFRIQAWLSQWNPHCYWKSDAGSYKSPSTASEEADLMHLASVCVFRYSIAQQSLNHSASALMHKQYMPCYQISIFHGNPSRSCEDITRPCGSGGKVRRSPMILEVWKAWSSWAMNECTKCHGNPLLWTKAVDSLTDRQTETAMPWPTTLTWLKNLTLQQPDCCHMAGITGDGWSRSDTSWCSSNLTTRNSTQLVVLTILTMTYKCLVDSM